MSNEICSSKKPRRFLPEPIEISSRSSTDRPLEHASRDTLTGGEGSQIRRRRKFTPQLVETGRRSVRGGSIPHNAPECPFQARSESLQDSDIMNNGYSTTPESSFSYHSLQRRYETRRHSFRVPDLPAIPSSCSEASDESELDSPPTLSKKPPQNPSKILYSDRARRESCDEEISSYLLSLAAQAAEQQLKEQALAAFPNEQVYQPVDHFAIDNDDEESSHDEDLLLPGQLDKLDARRKSAADLSSELECLRFYKQKTAVKQSPAIENYGNIPLLSEPLTHPPAGHDGSMDVESCSKPAQNGRHASPPMLGNDLIFPLSSSPETTIYDSGNSFSTTHRIYTNPGLWHASPHQGDHGADGLWMGTCKNNRRLEVMQTPVTNMQESISVPTARESTLTAESPGAGNSLAAARGLDMRNPVINEDAESYPSDDFVTQIYNYLSLGYPCVARYYDHELSKVSGIPVVELRQDDIRTDAKGFVFQEAQKIARKNTSNSCKRWHALRLYIHKRGSQRPCVPEEDANHEKWGVLERRGSWAV
ncbi:hypothetical protein P170DRAFT_359416 [Aspergillus steynii IBT 23096]|uniref:Uncharacterized protein n=1 Tax=Aspergillus steynii IBT 23096 TaxID=1392250 RepID=A0A2I2G6S9_9EURO|nr:uncharacterized protein P170DRAFT_359416 [Aspergillus steynii IBT 23096]PLB48581.1 hypothetical protein P170DRAFT_359416 [Aspergillus steynii IBT 23096]